MKNEEIGNIIKSVKELNSEGLKSFGNALGEELPEARTSELFGSLGDSMPSEAQIKAVTEMVDKAPEQTQKELAAAVLGFPSPTVQTRDKIWRIVVWSFSIVMVGAFLFIAIGAFQEKPQNPIASGDILLSIFTASVGFFAGLFAPSPGK